MKHESGKKKVTRKGAVFKTLILIIYVFVLIYLYNLLIEFGANPLIIFLIIIFVFLTFTGPFLKNRKMKTLYSKMFPDKKKKYQSYQKEEELNVESEKTTSQPKKLKEITLDFKYRRSIINKCPDCGMIITSFVKKCPNCGKAISSKFIIKKCPACGMIMANYLKKCPACGKPIPQQK